MPRTENSHIYQFGEYRLDTAEETLSRNDEKVKINRKTFQVLRLLVERPGEIISKHDFFETVWAESFVEDNVLTVTMTALRKALDENPKQPKLIENLPRKGYRFIADVEIIENAAPPVQTEENAAIVPELKYEGEINPKNRRTLAAIFIVCLLVLTAVAGFNYFERSRTVDFSAANRSNIESIAVLPFENQNPDTEYLSDGLTESVINNLSGLANLRVISRNSVFQYKGKNLDSMVVGGELNVQAVLTGRFIQRGDELIVSTELTDLRDNKQIWGRQYTRKINDTFILQQDISQDISETLRRQLTGAERQQLAKRETDSPEAFQLYLKGRYQWNKRTQDSFIKAVEFYNQAIEKDPTYALSYVGLANCYLSVNFKSPITREERVGMVKAAANKALEIDPKLGGEVHAVLAINSCFNEWDWTNADREYRRAIELSPNYATAHHWYAEFLATEGRFDESFAEYQRALELDPLSLAVKTDLGFNYYYSRQFDRAVEYLEKLKELNPNYSRIYYFLADVYEKKEMYAEAIAEDYQGSMLDGANLLMMSERNTALENAVKTSGAKGYYEKMAELESVEEGVNSPAVTLAMYHARLGERNKAFELLEKGYKEHSQLLVWLKVSPKFDDLRSDPRFADLIRRVGLP